MHHGRHFGQVTHTFCNVKALLANGLKRLGNPAPYPGHFSVSLHIFFYSIVLIWLQFREIREHFVFTTLLKSFGLEERLMKSSAEEIEIIADFVRKPAMPCHT